MTGLERLWKLADDLSGTGADVLSTFTYNPASQLKNEVRTNDAYAYTGSANVARSYTANGLNQYSSAGTASFGYDANGNLTSDGTTSYTYDAENRLVGTSAGAVLTYDPNGRLWQVSSGSATTQFLYDGDQLTAEYNGTNTLLRRYVHGTGEDDPLIWYEGPGLTARRSLQVNRQGSIVSIADAGGALIAIDSYDEYGIPGASNTGRFQYTGQAWLPEIGMYYYKARIYSPTLGRFLQTDPIGYKDQVNLYAYVGDDPVDYQDPSGTSGWPVLPSLGTVVNVLAGLGVEVVGLGPEDPVADAGAAYFWRRAAISYARDVARALPATLPAQQIRPVPAVNRPRPSNARPTPRGPTKSEARRGRDAPLRCSNPTCDAPHGGVTGTTECPDCDGKRRRGAPLPGPRPRKLTS